MGCSRNVERVVSNGNSNSSELSYCNVDNCFLDLNFQTLTCTVNWFLANPEEYVTEVFLFFFTMIL